MWNEAREYCLDQGADLVTIHSAEENQFASSVCDGVCWVGLNLVNNNTWVWVDGTLLDFSSWQVGTAVCGTGVLRRAEQPRPE